MQALQLVKFSPDFKEAVQYAETEKPSIKSPHEVLVRVRAAGVNPVEAKVTTGNMKAAQLIISLPAVIGGDFAGVVEEIGSQVKDFKVGDEVYGSLHLPFSLKGSFAQYTVVDTTKASIAKKPSHLSFEQAATAGIAFLTAYQGVIVNGRLEGDNAKENKTILVIGASGGVGSFAVQVAKAINPQNKVIGICSSRNSDYVRSLGADKVVNYDQPKEYEEFIKTSADSIDIVFDTVGGDDYYNQMDPLLKKKGVYSTAVGPEEHIGSKSMGVLGMVGMIGRVGARKLLAKHTYDLIVHLPHNKFRTHVAPLFESASINKDVSQDNIVPLSEGWKAYEKLMTHRTIGKIVFRVD